MNSKEFVEIIDAPSYDFEFVEAQDYNAPIRAYKISELSFEEKMQLIGVIEKRNLIIF